MKRLWLLVAMLTWTSGARAAPPLPVEAANAATTEPKASAQPQPDASSNLAPVEEGWSVLPGASGGMPFVWGMLPKLAVGVGKELTLANPEQASSTRINLIDDGRYRLELKTRWRDGTTHLRFDPIELMERLAAQIPKAAGPPRALRGRPGSQRQTT
jgi:hypothetical protein